MKLTIASLLLALCLFAQGDGFSPTSAMWFTSDGRFSIGMEAEASEQPVDFTADRIQPVQDEKGTPVFPKKISFSGSVSLRPRVPNYGWFGRAYEFKEDSLIQLYLEGANGQSYLLFIAILKANAEANTIYIPAHTLPDLGSFPASVLGAPLHLHLNIGMAGRGGADTEVQLHGHWE